VGAESETTTSSNDPDAKNVATPMPPWLNWVSVAVSGVPLLTRPLSELPFTVSESE
jgi:hypothetical protein